jgi:hypothetical protein
MRWIGNTHLCRQNCGLAVHRNGHCAAHIVKLEEECQRQAAADSLALEDRMLVAVPEVEAKGATLDAAHVKHR